MGNFDRSKYVREAKDPPIKLAELFFSDSYFFAAEGDIQREQEQFTGLCYAQGRLSM